MATKEPKIKYFLYARKSSESEDRQVASIEDQIAELKKVAEEFGLNVIEIFTESQSAKAPGRLVFNDMLKRVYEGEAQGVLCWKLDRLARNPIDGGQISWMLQQGLIQSIHTFGRVYLPADNVLMMQVELGMANQFVRDLSVNVKRGLRNKASKGWLPSGAPIGYRSTPGKEKGQKEMEIDPERFSLVRRIFDLMLTGNYTAPQVWKMTKEWNLTTVKKKKIGGHHLSRSGMYALLTNPFYYGYFDYPVGSGNWIKGAHKPMITEEEYNHIQSRLGKKGKVRPKTHLFAFTGMMRCGSCGSSITAETKTKHQKNGNIHDYIYYHCTKRKNENCIEKSVELKNLTAQIDELLAGITISEKFRDWAIKYLHEIRTREAGGLEVILENKHKELESVNATLSKLILTYTSEENADGSMLTAEELKTHKRDLLRRKIALEESLKQGSVEMEDWMALSEQTFNFARYARIWFEHGDNDTKKAILGCLGSNLILKDQKLNVGLHPFFLSVFQSRDKVEAELVSARTSEYGPTERPIGHSDGKYNSLLRDQGSNLGHPPYTYPKIS